MLETLLTIDCVALKDGGNNNDQKRSLGKHIIAALSQSGGFYAVNHGIEHALTKNVFAASRWFFAQPDYRKQAFGTNRWKRGFLALRTNRKPGFAPDVREAFDLGIDIPDDDPRVRDGKPLHGSNHWPDWPDAAAFREAVEHYFSAVRGFGFQLQELLALGLDLPADWFQRHYHNALSTMRLLRYPNPAQTLAYNEFPMAPHTDYGAFTFLSQDETLGLEHQDDQGKWHSVAPKSGALVVFGGELLRHWSNGYIKPLRHRVINVPGRERLSVCVFYNPDFDADLHCPPRLQIQSTSIPGHISTCGSYILAQAKTRADQLAMLNP